MNINEREQLIHEINLLPDFIIKPLRDVVHYIKIGIENEYVSKTTNEFYNSAEFRELVNEAMAEYRNGKTELMDI
ncbi:MAG: hypothetical protein HQK77_02875 [Desulfobacterales bacterium]|nr:hypothetical protein [Desulfobacterales bacterium]